MNRKAFELAISTLILITLGILTLIGIIVALTGGFDRFFNTSDPFIDTAETTAVKQNCQNLCNQKAKIIYCCEEYEISNTKLKCDDERLEISCDLDCTTFKCE